MLLRNYRDDIWVDEQYGLECTRKVSRIRCKVKFPCLSRGQQVNGRVTSAFCSADALSVHAINRKFSV